MQTERSEAPGGADPMIGAPEAMGTSLQESPQGSTKRIALFVAHGMGQQMPFEAIDIVARGLVCGICRNSGQHIDDTHAVRTRTVRFDVDGGQKVCERGEIEIEHVGSPGSAPPVHVHIYEAYWAPVTEGVVRGRDVLSFIWAGLRSGIARSLSNNVRRWMFGRVWKLEQTRSAFAAFLLTGLVMLGLFVLNLLATTIVSARIFSSNPKSWPDDELMISLTIIAGIVSLLLGLFIVPLLITQLIITRGNAGRRTKAFARQPIDGPGWMQRVWSDILLFLGGAAGLGIAVGGLALIAVIVMASSGGTSMSIVPEPMEDLASPPFMWYTVWGILFLVSLYARDKIIQYVGDVVAYVDSSRLDRFYDVRKKIKQKAFDLLHAIYSVRTTDSGDHYYDEVALIGHSLGSVIAYDALNGMINHDLLSSPDGDPAGTTDKVIDRTRLFLTFGSPLDKTAYLFTILARKSASVRERLATSKQPLINDWRYRGSMRWVNIYSPGDLIAGELNHYGPSVDEAEDPPDSKAIINARDPHAITPLVAHVQYWENDRVFDEVVASLDLSGNVRNLG